MKRVLRLIGVLASPILLQLPSLAQRNEVTWRNSIEADISNGAPARTICINAKSSAFASSDVQFKNYAYGVVRRYCPEDLGGGSPYMPGGTGSSQGDCRITQEQIYNAIQYKQAIISSGSGCSIDIRYH